MLGDKKGKVFIPTTAAIYEDIYIYFFFFSFRFLLGGLRLNQNIPQGRCVGDFRLVGSCNQCYKLPLLGGSATISPSCGSQPIYNNTSAVLQDEPPTVISTGQDCWTHSQQPNPLTSMSSTYSIGPRPQPSPVRVSSSH